MKKRFLFILSSIIFILTLSIPLLANDPLEVFKQKVEKIKLQNGLTALLVKREGPPIFSGYLQVKVGSIEEPPGLSGLAHFFEHLAFKGTSTIGSFDFQKEKVVLDKLYAVGDEIIQKKKSNASLEEIEALEAKLDDLQKEQVLLFNRNEFVTIYQRNGGGDLNATTSTDFTEYFVSLPSGKLELWAYMESERLRDPVFREFYKERDVVIEERRMRYDNRPEGKLYEIFMRKAFLKSPYGRNVIGTPEEILNIHLTSVQKFHELFYIPSRIVLVLVGNFDLKEAKKYLDQYFGTIPAKTDTPIEFNQEDLSNLKKETTILRAKAEPRFYLGFHRSAFPHPDDEVFDALYGILCDGRTSRLYSVLVQQKQMASDVECYTSLPGTRLDGLFTFYAVPLAPYTNQDVLTEVLGQLNLLKNQKVLDKELEKVRNKIESNLIWALKSNMGLASLLAFYESLSGNWQYLYQLRQRIQALQPEDIQRVAQKYFVPERQVTVFLERQ